VIRVYDEAGNANRNARGGRRFQRAVVRLCVPKRFRFLNAEWFGTIRAVQPFNRFPLGRSGNRLQDAV
jgi:hypothetical protein